MSGAESGHHQSISEAQGGGAAATLQGAKVDLAAMDEASRLDILEKAFDFRGDVTLGLADGRAISGYIFDRRKGAGLEGSQVRLLPPVGEDRITIAYCDVRTVEFGKDAAHGKSFETWVKKYVEKKLAGEKASIESEAL